MRLAASRIAAACALAAPPACFYVEPINQRPAVGIRTTSSDSVLRGDEVTLYAVADDPEGRPVSFEWRVTPCTDATTPGGCDAEKEVQVGDSITFRVPSLREDPDGPGPLTGAPVSAMRVVLRGEDDRGAVARPEQELILPVVNRPPDLELRATSRFDFAVTAPIEVYAKYRDADDGAGEVTLEWTAFSPTQAPAALTPFSVPADPSDPSDPPYRQAGQRLDPGVAGNWEIRVVATDRDRATQERTITVVVHPDRAPCIDAWAPIAPAHALPLTEPTLFRVQRVRDDLDPYPPAAGGPPYGELELRWSLQVGDGPRAPLANATSSLPIDPDAYAPGTQLQVRVEVFDRKGTPIPCADGAPTCSVSGDPACIQRLTWRAEAR